MLFCCLALLACLAGCSRADDTWSRVLESGTLRVGMDASFPPFEFVAADGTLAGLDVDLAQELARRMDVEAQFVANLPYDGLYDALAVGRVDVVISALVVNPARMADFAYSTCYFDAGQVLVVRAGATGIVGPDDLEGRRLAVEFGSRGDMQARNWKHKLPTLEIAPYQTANEALAALTAGEVDVALVDHVSALAVDGLVVAGEPVVAEPYAVAVPRGSQHLLRAINRALAEMQTDGTLESLTGRWLTHR